MEFLEILPMLKSCEDSSYTEQDLLAGAEQSGSNITIIIIVAVVVVAVVAFLVIRKKKK